MGLDVCILLNVFAVQPALLLTGAAGSSGSGGSANGAAAAEAAAALAPTPCGQAGGAAITPADHIKDMIKVSSVGCLSGPASSCSFACAFHVRGLWDLRGAQTA